MVHYSGVTFIQTYSGVQEACKGGTIYVSAGALKPSLQTSLCTFEPLLTAHTCVCGSMAVTVVEGPWMSAERTCKQLQQLHVLLLLCSASPYCT